MKKVIISIAILLIILVTIMSFLVASLVKDGFEEITGPEIEREYTFTKAICDGDSCQDYVIACVGTQMIGKAPITGAVVSIKPGWQDPRPQEQIDKECD